MNLPQTDMPRKIIALLVLAILATAACAAQYSLSSFKGEVHVKHAGKTITATADMKLGAADLIIIGQGSSAVVFDKRDSNLYSYNKPGEISVTSLIYEAKKASRSTTGSVHRNLSLGKQSSEEEGKMYIEKGKITLALEEYDPAGENFMIDAKVLAEYIAGAVKGRRLSSLPPFPAPLKHEATAAGALSFTLDNTLPEPLYINVIKFKRDANGEGLRISELGQPIGCYVLLPYQSIMRSQSHGINNSGEMHLLVATHYYFSIDELIERLSEELAKQAPGAAVMNLPIYLQEL